MLLATAPAQTATPHASPFSHFCPLLHGQQRFELLSLDIQQDFTEAVLFVRRDSLITSNFPGFEKTLGKLLPGLLDNVACRNGCDHDFGVEMLATETGHLFEHIWLEVLCCEKLRYSESASFSGETAWNWHRDPVGLFHISISAGIAERQLIERSVYIADLILQRSLDAASQ